MPSPLPSHLLAALFALELLLGGQARLPFSPTPTLHHRAMAKTDGLAASLAYVNPFHHPVTLTRLFGWLMCGAGVAVAVPVPEIRMGGAVVGGLIAGVGVWSQWYMGVAYWVPVVNGCLAGAICWVG